MFLILRVLFLTFMMYLLLGSICFAALGGGALKLLTGVFLTFVLVSLLYGKRFALAQFKARPYRNFQGDKLMPQMRRVFSVNHLRLPEVYIYDSEEFDLVVLSSLTGKSFWLIPSSVIEGETSLNSYELNSYIKCGIEREEKRLEAVSYTYFGFLFYSVFKLINFPFLLIEKIIKFFTFKNIDFSSYLLVLYIPGVEFLLRLLGFTSDQGLTDNFDNVLVESGLRIRAVESKKYASFEYDFFNLCRMFGYRRDFYSIMIN